MATPFLIIFSVWDGETKRRAFSGSLGLYPDCPAMDFDNTLDEGESNSRPFARGIQFFEQSKNSRPVGLFDTHTIIFHKNDLFSFIPATNLDQWIFLLAHIFCGVINQILENFAQADAVSGYGW